MAGKVSLAINALLIIAVIFLFTKGTPTASTDSDNSSPSISNQTGNASGLVVAFIMEDSILSNYDFVEVEGRKLEQKVAARTRSLQQEMVEYESEVAKWENLLRQQQDEALYNQAMQEMQSRERSIQSGQNELDRMQMTFSQELTRRVQEYLKEFADEKGIDLILNDAQMGSSILFADSTMDVTQQVIDGLNVRYAEENSEEE